MTFWEHTLGQGPQVSSGCTRKWITKPGTSLQPMSHHLTGIHGQGKQLRSSEGTHRQEGNDAGTPGLGALPWGTPASPSQQGQMCNHHLVSMPLVGRRRGGRGKALASNILILERRVFYLQGGRTRGGWTRAQCHEGAHSPGEEGTDLMAQGISPAVKQPLQP